jgi:hypothetical protein
MSRIDLISRRGAMLLVALLVLSVLAGCSDGGPPRGSITGKVTVAGQPLKEGRILFKPQAPNHGPAVSAAVRDGAYSLDDSDGPVLGANRVEVEASPNLGFAIDDEAAFAKRQGAPLPANPIPSEFNSKSTLAVDVQEGENVFNVPIP